MPPTPILPFGVKEVRQRLVGFERMLQAAEQNGAGYDDDAILELIPQQIRLFEDEVQVRIVPVQVVADPDGTYAVAGAPLDVTNTYEVVEDQPYPYYQDQSYAFLRVQLRQYPVRIVQRLRMILDPQNVVATIPPEWFRVEPKTGIFHIMPVTGAISIVGIATAYSIIQAQFGASTFVPQMLAFDYIAGLPNSWYTLREYSDLKRALAEYCAKAVLDDICETWDAGLMSKSVSGDGATLSKQYERAVRRRQELMANVMKFEEKFKARNTPFFLDSV